MVLQNLQTPDGDSALEVDTEFGQPWGRPVEVDIDLMILMVAREGVPMAGTRRRFTPEFWAEASG